MVPACAEDAARVTQGGQPMTRMVDTGQGAQPYWNAGPAYAPWAGGYFGGAGAVVGGLLAGTLLGSLLSAPSAFAGSGDGVPSAPDLPDGGDFSGADFRDSDFAGDSTVVSGRTAAVTSAATGGDRTTPSGDKRSLAQQGDRGERFGRSGAMPGTTTAEGLLEELAGDARRRRKRRSGPPTGRSRWVTGPGGRGRAPSPDGGPARTGAPCAG